ncbi:MAG: ABC transporter permease [bacterium]
MAYKIFHIIRKEFHEEISYRLDFFLHVLYLFLFTLVFFFVAKIVGGAGSVHLERYGGDYFSFVLVGLAFVGYLNTGLQSFSDEIRREQIYGTMEILLSTPTPLTFILCARLLWNFLYESFHLGLYFAAGVFLLNARYTGESWHFIPLILVLSFISHAGLGMISASFILVLKRGNPVNYLLGTAAQLLGGVYFPVSVLPAALQTASAFLPITYSLRLMREVCIRGAAFREIAGDLAVLAALSAVLLPVSVACFNWALRRARMDGSLTHY